MVSTKKSQLESTFQCDLYDQEGLRFGALKSVKGKDLTFQDSYDFNVSDRHESYKC